MSLRFEKYRVRDNVSTLSEGTFNAIFRDVDLRIATLEDLKVAWEVITDDLTGEGLRKLNEALLPIYLAMQNEQALATASKETVLGLQSDLETLFTESQEQLALDLQHARDDADALIAQIPNAIVQSELDAYAETVTTALGGLEEDIGTVSGSVGTLAGTVETEIAPLRMFSYMAYC